MAVLADTVMKAGAVALGFDAVFSEDDRLPLVRETDFPYPLDDAMVRRLADLPDNDTVFADVIHRSPVVLGQAARETERETERENVNTSRESLKARTTFSFKGKDDAAREVALARAFPADHLTRNVPVLEKAATGRGMISLIPERDNVVRRVPAVFRHGETFLASLSVEILRVAVGAPTLAIEAYADQGIASVIVPKAGRIPTDGKGRIWVHYSHTDAGRYISAKDVLKGAVPAERLRGRFVLFGTSAQGLGDNRATPVDRAIPGVEVHAQIIESVLSASYLSRPGYFLGAEAMLIVLIGGLLIWLVPTVGARWTLLLFVAIAVGAAVGGTDPHIDATIKAAEVASAAAQGTPGAPAAKAAEEATKSAAAAAMGAAISAAAAASGADKHMCTTPLPIPPHGPGVVIDGSATVLINNAPACRMGDTVLEAVGPPNKIVKGCITVIIGG